MKTILLVILTINICAFTSFAQIPNSEIYLFSIDKSNETYSFANGRNITNSSGYDNQPSFSLDNKSVLFTSNRRDNNFDIYRYNLSDGKISALTTGEAYEFSAKELDKNTITFVREGKDQLMTVIKYDRRTKKESLAFKINEPIAYYAFNQDKDALVWVRYAFMMHFVNTEKSINRYVANYAQPSVPHLIPNSKKFSFMQRHPDDSLWIKEFDPSNEAVRPIVQSKDGKKNYAWMPNGSLLVGSGTKLYKFNEKTDKVWVLLADLEKFGIKEMTRLAVSSDGKYLAIVDNK